MHIMQDNITYKLKLLNPKLEAVKFSKVVTSNFKISGVGNTDI